LWTQRRRSTRNCHPLDDRSIGTRHQKTPRFRGASPVPARLRGYRSHGRKLCRERPSLALPLTLGSSVIARAQLLARSACGFRRRMLWPLSIGSRLECPSVQTASTMHGETQDSGTPTPRPFRVSIAAARTAKVGDLRVSEPLELEALRVRWLPVATHPNGSMASECIMVCHSQCRHVGSFKNRCPIARCLERRIAQCKRLPRPLD
jgi:hypothetical protein